jgi:hypothetical protein
LGQEAAAVANAAPEVPGKLLGALKNPVQTAYNNPLTVVTLGYGAAKAGVSAVKGAVNATKTGAANIGSKLESVGATAQNYAAGIRSQTVEAMTRSGQNPADVGAKIGGKLVQEKILGTTPKETFDNLIQARARAGRQVQEAVQKIHKNGLAAIPADDALQPLFDALSERAGAITSARKAMAKPFRQVYNFLLDQAKENGMLSLDDVKKALKEIGPMTHKGSEEVQAAMSELYGVLANVQDNIITTIAKSAKNPALRDNLLKANERFSLFARIAPDLEKAAAKEAVGSTSMLAHPIDAVKKMAANKGSAVLNNIGTKLRGLSPSSSPIAQQAPVTSMVGLQTMATNAANKSELEKVRARLKAKPHAK